MQKKSGQRGLAVRKFEANKHRAMKKFSIIFTDAKTGRDLYENFVVESHRMAMVANEVDTRGAHYRLIEDVTAMHPANFIANAWNTIPLRAFDNYKE